MKNKKNVFDVKLDEEEQAISDSLDRGEWETVENLEEEMAFAKQTSANYLTRKDAKVNLRLSKTDLEQLKQKAAYKGLPYQTLASSIIHQYVAGHFGDNIFLTLVGYH